MSFSSVLSFVTCRCNREAIVYRESNKNHRLKFPHIFCSLVKYNKNGIDYGVICICLEFHSAVLLMKCFSAIFFSGVFNRVY